MIAATGPDRRAAKLLIIDTAGGLREMPRARLATLFEPGDLVVANDAATLPASLPGRHHPSGAAIEIRLAAWHSAGDPTRFTALAFGAGDHRTPTEDRPTPPPLFPGDRLELGPLTAIIEDVLDHPRLIAVRFQGSKDSVLAGIARHGRPVQYAHVPQPLALWDVWTAAAGVPFAFEPPSAGFALDWSVLAEWRRRGVGIATLTHAAGLSSTGDPELDARLPFDEPYRIPATTARAVDRARQAGQRIIAIGTTVVRALESAAQTWGRVVPGDGVARGRITPDTSLQVVDTILSGVHQPGESHFELLRAFADDDVLDSATTHLIRQGFRSHEFGDSVLIERRRERSALADRRRLPVPDAHCPEPGCMVS